VRSPPESIDQEVALERRYIFTLLVLPYPITMTSPALLHATVEASAPICVPGLIVCVPAFAVGHAPDAYSYV